MRAAASNPTFDAIVVGSGMSGGWAAKELAERGLKVLVIERGRHVEHGTDYTDMQSPWEDKNWGRVNEDEIARDYYVQSRCYAFNTTTQHWWVNDRENPYTPPEGRPFSWIRGYHLGGLSLMWGRPTYRLREIALAANAADGRRKEERSVGKACVRKCISRWSLDNTKKK